MIFKYITLLFLIINPITSLAFKYNPIFLNKSLNVNTSFNDDLNMITITFDDDISNVDFQSVHGIDGLDVFGHEVFVEKLNREYLIKVDYDRPDGESFIVLSISYEEFVEGAYISRKEVVSIAVGELSEAQKKDRLKPIKIINSGYDEIDSSGQVKRGQLRVHEFRLHEKN